jgi:hypothetical protein
MSLAQIAKMFFPVCRNVHMSPKGRIRKVVNAGLLTPVKVKGIIRIFYMVTGEGLKLLERKKISTGLRTMELSEVWDFKHNERVAEVRIIFDQLLGFKGWISKRILKKRAHSKKVPDGLVSNGKDYFVICVESNPFKSRRKCAQVLAETCARWKEDTILYIVGEQKLQGWLLKRAKDWPSVYFTTIAEFEKIEDRAEEKRFRSYSL